ncbi:MAG: phytanoyl-CoA dioxygenase [Gemmatimonadetes bacterium]|jgi:ectoine hydroxylase-related dioxygenase (phytanoyl-CoA dioxygenase family)|nr:phytanoyl-CoA dioxygenase [Gemmatimonadota bacterium]MBT5325528.1 phytanoyl-CoA dioxygenase [Gemmatimonadota bacterium]MBT6618624.1 phytanoyl-CoA dioxygenase [Gemmatimonadota bacterium]MBT6903634.1 phytanoyl-CoA dioxygenase [Gemmatimonadota bacterium]MBT7417487.1 phytanoyl-CoA dioxygenase [Gemmatimonadota bacterium]|tara:strand:- start:412 stop:1212 length:801 start_codon:yes stop_codon:yes gene_type:complete
MNLQQCFQRVRMDGFCVLENVVPGEAVASVRESVARATKEYGREEAEAKGIGHVPGFIRYDQSLASYLADTELMRLVEGVLGPAARVSFTSATINYPGNSRGSWHADWPFNQKNAGRIPAPYPDALMHLTTLWMLSPFSCENGGTLLVPGSHRATNNPTGDMGVDPQEPYPTEVHATGPAGSVLVLDSRIWHATAANTSDEARVSVVVRYAPWWLNTRVLMPGSAERERLLGTSGRTENEQPSLPHAVYDGLPVQTKPLFAHWVED